MANGGSYGFMLGTDNHDLRAASNQQNWMEEHYDAIHDLCSKAQQLIEQGYDAPYALVKELADYGLRYCKLPTVILDSQRGSYNAAQVASAEYMLDIHRNHELRRQGRLDDNHWLGSISAPAWHLMAQVERVDKDMKDTVLFHTGPSTVNMKILKSLDDDPWRGEASDRQPNARVRLRAYETPMKALRYMSKLGPIGNLLLTVDGRMSDSAIEGLRGAELDRLVDDPILGGAGLIILNIDAEEDLLRIAVDEQHQRWHPIVFGTCQRLEGIR